MIIMTPFLSSGTWSSVQGFFSGILHFHRKNKNHFYYFCLQISFFKKQPANSVKYRFQADNDGHPHTKKNLKIEKIDTWIKHHHHHNHSFLSFLFGSNWNKHTHSILFFLVFFILFHFFSSLGWLIVAYFFILKFCYFSQEKTKNHYPKLKTKNFPLLLHSSLPPLFFVPKKEQSWQKTKRKMVKIK